MIIESIIIDKPLEHTFKIYNLLHTLLKSGFKLEKISGNYKNIKILLNYKKDLEEKNAIIYIIKLSDVSCFVMCNLYVEDCLDGKTFQKHSLDLKKFLKILKRTVEKQNL